MKYIFSLYIGIFLGLIALNYINESNLTRNPKIASGVFIENDTEIEKNAYFEPSKRLSEHIKMHPDVYKKITKYFGDKSIVIAELISKESSLNPRAVNATSGACGLFQALPCSKMECSLDDIDCQIKWGKQYIENRYGDIESAISFHNSNGWY